MVTPVVCADPVSDIRRIARVLVEIGLTALTVVNESQTLLGMVSRGDILLATVADSRRT
jgi:CBS domain-containing protein